MKKRKICIFTGTRAEYGLLKPLIDKLKQEPKIELQLLITGMHLSPEFGLTDQSIDIQGIKRVEKVEILLSSDTPIGISKAMGLGMISFSEAFSRLKPDLLVGLGDRFELFSAVSAALVANIPVAHIHGGELTYGAYDDAFRHSITKMAHLHFTSSEEYRQRVIQLGENPQTVYNVGSLGLENIKNMKLLTFRQLEESISFKLDKPFFVVTFHPVTLEKNTAEKQMKELINALGEFKTYKIIFTKPNADNEGRTIIKLMDDYVNNNPDQAIAFDSMGQLKYLSALKYCTMMIGNSSSGIIEMPFFNKPTINIGDRQKGRIMARAIIQCEPNRTSIKNAINMGLNISSKSNIIKSKNDASKKIKKILVSTRLSTLIKKEFYDLPK